MVAMLTIGMLGGMSWESSAEYYRLVNEFVREYKRLHNIVKEVDRARILVGFHFRNSDLQGSRLGGKVGRYVVPSLLPAGPLRRLT
jgi:hypothetical protein